MRIPAAGSIITAVAQLAMLNAARSAHIVAARLQLLEHGVRNADSTFSLLKAGACGQNDP